MEAAIKFLICIFLSLAIGLLLASMVEISRQEKPNILVFNMLNTVVITLAPIYVKALLDEQ